MNSLSHTIRSFNRFELKYLITLKQARIFKSALRAYLLPDEHSSGSYGLSSLYYDSPDYRCYWEKVDGLRFRRKLRIRQYETGEPLTEDTTVFVEIKQRIDRVTQKRRAVLSYRDALRLCNQREIPDCLPEDEAVVEEIGEFVWRYNLSPACVIRYSRLALVGTDYDLGLRVTFDTALSYRTLHLDLREQGETNLPMFPAHYVVMEIKVNESIPYWLTEMVAAHNLQLVRTSKYCRSLEVAQNVPSLPWRLTAA
jgi:SPX domain protein involved in polyphosphate accumulation